MSLILVSIHDPHHLSMATSKEGLQSISGVGQHQETGRSWVCVIEELSQHLTQIPGLTHYSIFFLGGKVCRGTLKKDLWAKRLNRDWCFVFSVRDRWITWVATLSPGCLEMTDARFTHYSLLGESLSYCFRPTCVHSGTNLDMDNQLCLRRARKTPTWKCLSSYLVTAAKSLLQLFSLGV